MPPEHPRVAASRSIGTSVRTPGRRNFDRKDGMALLALLLLSTALGVAKLLRRPDLFRGAWDVLFGDTGFNLFVAERLLAGRVLYGDVAFQYGPVPPLLHAGLAAIFGNTLSTYYLLLLLVSLANITLAYLLIRACATRVTALVVVGLGLTATLLIPGSTLGAISGTSYVPLERTVLLLTALLWTPPVGRPRHVSILLGLAIGAWQGVRFGGAGFLLVAVVMADLVALRFGRHRHPEVWRRWGRSILWTIAAIVGLQLVWSTMVVVTLPSAVAADVLWPRHMLESYRSWLLPELRWPRWGGWGMLAGQFLSPLVGAFVGVAGLAYYLTADVRSVAGPERQKHSLDQVRLLIPFLFYAVASVAFFRMVFHFHQFGWALVIPAAWALERRNVLVRTTVALLLIPCFALNARISFVDSRDDDQQAFATPSGEHLWSAPRIRDELTALADALRGSGNSHVRGHATSVLILPLGAGFLHTFEMDNSLRQPWFYQGMVRPYDEDQLLDSLASLDAVVVVNPESSMAQFPFCASERTGALSQETCSRLALHLDPPLAVGRFLVYPLRK